MGKIYGNYDTSAFVGGVNPEVQKNHKGLKSTTYNKSSDKTQGTQKPSGKKKSK